MQEWSIPLSLAVAAFLGWTLWRLWPAPGLRRRERKDAEALRARIRAAADPLQRAAALCDAADAEAGVGGAGRAAGYYLRAMRSAPASAEVVRRAAARLGARPRTLEALLWRQLGAVPWAGQTREAVAYSLDVLARLYAGRLRNGPRARALARAKELLQP